MLKEALFSMILKVPLVIIFKKGQEEDFGALILFFFLLEVFSFTREKSL